MISDKRILLLALLLPLSQARGSVSTPVVEHYTVNAQYRGEIKKGYSDVGEGKAAFERLDGNTFRIQVKTEVKHPEKDVVYRFRIHETFAMRGDTIELMSEDLCELNASTKPYEQSIKEILPFTFLVRSLPVPDQAHGSSEREFHYLNATYVLRYRMTDQGQEVGLYKDDSILGKFFIKPGAPGELATLTKFRIPFTEDRLVVSFVRTDPPPMASRSVPQPVRQ